MKTKRLQLMIMATLFLGVNIGGASVAQGATLQHKSTVVTKEANAEINSIYNKCIESKFD